MGNDVRRQASLGTSFSDVTSGDSKIQSLMMARVIKVYYKYQTVELESLSGKLTLGKGNNTEGKFSAPYPKSFTGMTPENEVYGTLPVITPGMLVLVGFIDSNPSNPIIINSYGLNEHNKQLVRTPLLSGDIRDKDSYKFNTASYTLNPSLTYNFKDGEGNEVNTWNGYTFQSITSDENNLPIATDYMDGSYYSDIYVSKYGDESLIEPRVKKAPAIFFKHQGEFTQDNEIDNHIYMDYIEPTGTHRTSSMDREDQWRTSVEQDDKGNWRVQYQADSLILDDGLDYIEFGLDASKQRFYIENPEHSFEVNDEGILVDGKPILANVDDTIQEALKQLEAIESKMDEVQSILEGLGERSLRELINATNDAIAKTDANSTQITTLSKAINENTNSIKGMIEKYDNFIETVTTYFQTNDGNINSIRTRLSNLETANDLEPLKKDLEKYKYKTYKDIKVIADLPRYFAGYDAIVQGSGNTSYDYQALAVDSYYYFLLFKPTGSGDKRNILVVYDKNLKEQNKYFVGEGQTFNLHLDKPSNTTNRYLYTKLDDTQLVSYDLTTVASKDVLTFDSITTITPRATYNIPNKQLFVKLRDKWLVQVEDTACAVYSNDLSTISAYQTLPKIQDQVGLLVDGSNIAILVSGTENSGFKYINSDNTIDDYTYSNAELKSFIDTKFNITNSSIKQKSAFSSSDVYLSTTVYNEDASYGKTKGILILEHKSASRDTRLKEPANRIQEYSTIVMQGNKVIDNKTAKTLTTVEDVINTLIAYNIDHYSINTDLVDLTDFNSNNKLPKGINVTFNKLSSDTFSVIYNYIQTSQVKKFVIKKTGTTFSYTYIDNEPILDNVDVKNYTYIGRAYLTNATNLPLTYTEGFIDQRKSGSNLSLLFTESETASTYIMTKKGNTWSSWVPLSSEFFRPKGGGSDTYKSMTELVKSIPTAQWEINTKVKYSDTIVTAIHGGGIEIGTTELASEVANTSNKDYFSFLGKKSSNNSELHVTSTNYDEPTLYSMIRRCDYSVAIHGASGIEKKILLGGSDPNKEIVRKELTDAGFVVEDAPSNLAGTEPNNITNQTKRLLGIQLELTTAQRKAFFTNDDWSNSNRSDKANWTEELFKMRDAISKAITQFTTT